MKVDHEGSILVGPQYGWVVRFIEVVPNEESDGVLVTVYMDRPLKVTATVLANGTVIEW